MQWHSFTSLELSVPDIPSAEEETRDFMQIIKIFLPKKKNPRPQTKQKCSASLQKELVTDRGLGSSQMKLGSRYEKRRNTQRYKRVDMTTGHSCVVPRSLE